MRKNAQRYLFVLKILHKWFVLYFSCEFKTFRMNCARTHNEIFLSQKYYTNDSLYIFINLQRFNMNCAKTHNDICSKILYKKFVLFLSYKFTTFKHEFRKNAQRYFFVSKILHKWFFLYFSYKFTTFKHELRQNAQRYLF